MTAHNIPYSEQDTKLCSPKMISSTIMHDIYIRYWILAALKKINHPLKKKIFIFHYLNLITRLITVPLIIYIFFLNKFPLRILLAIPALFGIIFFLEISERSLLKRTRKETITKGMDEQKIQTMTLYTIIERQSNELSILSLVDISTLTHPLVKFTLFNLILFYTLFLPRIISFQNAIPLIITIVATAKMLILENYSRQKSQHNPKQISKRNY